MKDIRWLGILSFCALNYSYISTIGSMLLCIYGGPASLHHSWGSLSPCQFVFRIRCCCYSCWTRLKYVWNTGREDAVSLISVHSSNKTEICFVPFSCPLLLRVTIGRFFIVTSSAICNDLHTASRAYTCIILDPAINNFINNNWLIMQRMSRKHEKKKTSPGGHTKRK